MNKQLTLVSLVASLAACATPIDPAPEVASPEPPGAVEPAPVHEATREESPLQSADQVWTERPPIRSRRWLQGERVELTRPSSICDARRWGEWIRIECGAWSSSVAQLAGPVRGVAIEGSYDDAERYVVFPIAGRARRVFQLASVTGGWRAPWSTSVDAVISVDWEDGARSPILSVH